MKISKLLILTLIPLTLALSSGCSILKKKSAPAPAPTDAAVSTTPVATPTPEPAPAPIAAEAPAPTPAKTPQPPVWQDVAIRSTPSGATVKINGQTVGTTPLSAQFELGQHYEVELLLAGYLIHTQTVQAQSSGGGGIALGKAGMVSYHPAAFPSELRVSLSRDKDPFKAMEKAVAALDAQLEMHKITPDAYKEKVTEVTRFYAQGK